MKKMGAVAVSLVLSGCSAWNYLFTPGQALVASEAGRADVCPADSARLSVRYLLTAETVLNWEASVGLDLHPGEKLAPGSYALVTLGQRESGGYGLLVDPSAYRSGDVVRLHVTQLEPPAGVTPPDGPTSPCVLVRLPAGSWTGVDVYDQNGKRRASSY